MGGWIDRKLRSADVQEDPLPITGCPAKSTNEDGTVLLQIGGQRSLDDLARYVLADHGFVGIVC